MKRFPKLFSLIKPEWLTRHVILLFITLIIFILAMVWSEPIPQAAAMQINQHNSPENLILLPDTGHIDNIYNYQEPQYFNSRQTNGVITGAVILLFIILSGVITGFQLSKTD